MKTLNKSTNCTLTNKQLGIVGRLLINEYEDLRLLKSIHPELDVTNTQKLVTQSLYNLGLHRVACILLESDETFLLEHKFVKQAKQYALEILRELTI